MMNADVAAVHAAIRGGTTSDALHHNPMARMLNANIAEARADFVALDFEPPDSMLQGAGVLQGGAVTAMLDFAMAFATQTGIPQGATCATVSLTVSFLRAAANGRYRAEGTVERRGRSIAFAHARLVVAGTESIVATSTSVLVVRAESPRELQPGGTASHGINAESGTRLDVSRGA